MSKRKLFRSLIFFLVGVGFFWFVYRDMDIDELKGAMRELKYEWLILSFFFAMINLYLRAIRWRKLITPMNYFPKTHNLFISVLVLYLTNLIIPRGGEVTRCGVISKYEKIPFTKLIGTVFVERLTDLLAFTTVLIVILVWQFSIIQEFWTKLEFEMDFSGFKSKMIITGIVIIIFIFIYLVLSRLGLFKALRLKLARIKDDFIVGIRTILELKGRWMYIFQTYLILLLWLLMFYVIFFAYPPTEKLTITAALFTYGVGTLAYLLPIQAGIGVWHLLVIQCLFLFGVDMESGTLFALIAHTFTNLVYLVFGALGLMILPLVNNNKKGK